MPLVKWLIEGTIYASVLIFIILVSQGIYPRLWLAEYPKPLRAAAAPMSRGEKRAKKLLDVPLQIIKVGYPVFSGFVYKAAMGQAFNTWYGFAHLLILYNTFIVIKLLLSDGLIFCLITPRCVMVEGTREMKSEYKDFGFHAKKALSEFGMSVVLSALVTGVVSIK